MRSSFRAIWRFGQIGAVWRGYVPLATHRLRVPHRLHLGRTMPEPRWSRSRWIPFGDGGDGEYRHARADARHYPGGPYPLDVFHAERHTNESNFRIETTIDRFVPLPPPT